MEHLCSTPPSIHEKVGCRLGPSHRTLSMSTRPSSAHLSAFSLRNSPRCALILINMVKRPKFTLWCRTLTIWASISPSGECRRRGSLPSPALFEATVISPLESVSSTMGCSCGAWVRRILEEVDGASFFVPTPSLAAPVALSYIRKCSTSCTKYTLCKCELYISKTQNKHHTAHHNTPHSNCVQN